SVAAVFFFFSSRRRHTRFSRDWSSDVCSSDLRSFIQRPQAGPAIEIVVGVRDDSGKVIHTERPLHIAALDWGHFLTYTVGEGRDERFYGGPATADHVRKALADLKATLTQPAF